ncbi:MAG: hypothetical protein ABSC23_11130 [Bryobacteraceae bacterium]|jgi:hypothetical protein
MPLIQVRDVPDHIYRLLAELAGRERRSLAQQAVAALARGLEADVDAKGRRRTVLKSLPIGVPPRVKKLRNPAALIREDRRR